MWPPWRRPSPRVHSASTKPKPNFSCSTFKDIHILCSPDDSSPRNSSAAPDFSYSVHRAQQQDQYQHENQDLLRYRQHSPSSSTKKVFHRVRVASSLLRNWPTRSEPLAAASSPASQIQSVCLPSQTLPDANRATPPPVQPEPVPRIWLPGAETRIVVYFTSLRVVRPTFDACWSVQSILNGFRVAVDERDVSMYSGFLEELQQILGIAKEKLTLPRVFVGGQYIGGAEEVRQLHEIGELKKLVEELPAANPVVCVVCGGHRFVLCADCNGSHKVYSDKGGFRSCTACKENGLIKCPICYPTALAP